MTAIRSKVDPDTYGFGRCARVSPGGHSAPFHVDKRGIVTQQRNRISGDWCFFASDGSAANTSTRDIYAKIAEIRHRFEGPGLTRVDSFEKTMPNLASRPRKYLEYSVNRGSIGPRRLPSCRIFGKRSRAPSVSLTRVSFEHRAA